MTKTLNRYIKFGIKRSGLHTFVHTLKTCLLKKADDTVQKDEILTK